MRRAARPAAPKAAEPGFLGIEAGGTRTSACWLSESGTSSSPSAFGPANLKLLDDAALRQHLQAIARSYPVPHAVGIGMAGTRTAQDRARLQAAAQSVWPSACFSISNDLDTALSAADLRLDQPRILVLSGTGSCCYGLDPQGKSERVGGWGHLLGDQGSAYDISFQALRAVIRSADRTGRWGPLARTFLRHLHLNEPNQLISWILAAPKGAIASLAPHVFRAAAKSEPIARRIIDHAVDDLAESALACAQRLASPRQPVQFLLAGGVLTHQQPFASRVRNAIRAGRPHATISVLQNSGALGAARLAQQAWHSLHNPSQRRRSAKPARSPRNHSLPTSPIPVSTRISPTEQRNPRSMDLDRLSASAAVDLMLSEEALVPDAVLREKSHLIRALHLIHHSLKNGGRLFYVGAGTSGRLGVLDASECPPTFRSPPDWVQGIIAGGAEAIFRAVEGAEDDVEAGRRAVEFREVRKQDTVVGIAASGRTPFVWGALSEAKSRGAATILVCFNPHLRFSRDQRPKVVIAPDLGPEVLTGSTRLKSGTATKLILNLFTTLTMVRLGKVVSNLMVDLNPANAKLRDRAIRIVRELTGVGEPSARTALERHGWLITQALKSLSPTPPPIRNPSPNPNPNRHAQTGSVLATWRS